MAESKIPRLIPIIISPPSDSDYQDDDATSSPSSSPPVLLEEPTLKIAPVLQPDELHECLMPSLPPVSQELNCPAEETLLDETTCKFKDSLFMSIETEMLPPMTLFPVIEPARDSAVQPYSAVEPREAGYTMEDSPDSEAPLIPNSRQLDPLIGGEQTSSDLPTSEIVDPPTKTSFRSPTIDYEHDQSISDLQALVQLLQSELRETTERLLSERATLSQALTTQHALKKELEALRAASFQDKEQLLLERQRYDQIYMKYSHERQLLTKQEMEQHEKIRQFEIVQEKFKKMEHEFCMLKNLHEKDKDVKRELQERMTILLHQSDEAKKLQFTVHSLEATLSEKNVACDRHMAEMALLVKEMAPLQSSQKHADKLEVAILSLQTHLNSMTEKYRSLKEELRIARLEKAQLLEEHDASVHRYTEELTFWRQERATILKTLDETLAKKEMELEVMKRENEKLHKDVTQLEGDLCQFKSILRKKSQDFTFKWAYVHNVLEKYILAEDQRVNTHIEIFI
jgi:hypothetical protein